MKRQFKGECRLCGAKGHKAVDCWDNDKQNALPIIRKGHQINLLPSRILERKSLGVTIAIKKVTP
jgi:hypothetical protein